MMDTETFTNFKDFAVDASAYTSKVKLNLSQAESELFDYLKHNGKLLEQERISQKYIVRQLRVCLT